MRSFRRRFALTHLAVALAMLSATAGTGYWVLARAIHSQLDAALVALAETEAGTLQMVTEPPRVLARPARAPFSFARLDRLVQIIDDHNQVVASSANLGGERLPAPSELMRRMAAGETVFQTLTGFGDEPVRMVSLPARPGPNRDGPLHVVQVAASLDDVNRVLATAGVLLAGMGLALALAMGATGALLTRRVFGTIAAIVQQARGIGQASLSQRLPHPGSHDEIGRLVDTLNDMLARLENTFEVQRRFTADASHELRSPLSRLRTGLELALRRPREPAAYVDTLRDGLREVERLTKLVEELMVLARLDAGQQHTPADTVELRTLLADSVLRQQPVAQARQVRLQAPAHVLPTPVGSARQDDLMVNASTSALGLVMANLLDNALKYAPPGSTVQVDVQRSQGQARVSVADTGPGLKPEELARVFDRFFRGADARASEFDGVGLGLALSQAIVRAHGGRITAGNQPQGGALFEVWLPLVGGPATPVPAAS